GSEGGGSLVDTPRAVERFAQGARGQGGAGPGRGIAPRVVAGLRPAPRRDERAHASLHRHLVLGVGGQGLGVGGGGLVGLPREQELGPPCARGGARRGGRDGSRGGAGGSGRGGGCACGRGRGSGGGGRGSGRGGRGSAWRRGGRSRRCSGRRIRS